jgi:hypothetical protein
MTASDFSDIFQALVRLLLVLAALIKFCRSGWSNGRRSYDQIKTRWNWRNCDAVVGTFALMQAFGVVLLLVRALDAPLATVDIMRSLILPTTIVSNILLAVHFLNGQVNKLIAHAIEVVKCKLLPS